MSALAEAPAALTLRHLLVYARHGETDWNVEGRLQGQHDIPLNDNGRRQARRNGQALAAWLERDGRTPDSFAWMASPLCRARETMELMRTEMGLDPAGYRTLPELQEVAFGAWEGFTMMELQSRDPDLHDARLFDKWGFVPPGGESYAMLSARIAGWASKLEGDTICVAHGAVHRVLRGLLEGIPQAEAPALDVPQDRLYVWRDGCAAWI